jgi:oligopeptide/dipeptide ABC transporter ATP-binding protein
MADEVIVMYTSQKMEQGGIREIFKHPSHPYTQGLFDSLPDLARPKGRLKAIEGFVPPLTEYPNGCRFHPRCPFVMEKCRQGAIPEFLLEGGQKAKCLLHDQTDESLKKLGKR